MDEIEEEGCEIANTIEFLGRKHMLGILKMMYDTQGPMRFSEFSKILKINTKTLSDRLKELVDSGILNKLIYNETPPRSEYVLTKAGHDLTPLFDELQKFEKKHVVSFKH